MPTNKDFPTTTGQQALIVFSLMILTAAMLVGCGPSSKDLDTVDCTPLLREVWDVAMPEAEGLDAMLMAELYYNAARLDTICSLLIIKNDKLIAVQYFNDSSIYPGT